MGIDVYKSLYKYKPSAISGDSSDGVIKSGGAPQSADLETSGSHPGPPQLGKIISVTTLEFAGVISDGPVQDKRPPVKAWRK